MSRACHSHGNRLMSYHAQGYTRSAMTTALSLVRICPRASESAVVGVSSRDERLLNRTRLSLVLIFCRSWTRCTSFPILFPDLPSTHLALGKGAQPVAFTSQQLRTWLQYLAGTQALGGRGVVCRFAFKSVVGATAVGLHHPNKFAKKNLIADCLTHVCV